MEAQRRAEAALGNAANVGPVSGGAERASGADQAGWSIGGKRGVIALVETRMERKPATEPVVGDGGRQYQQCIVRSIIACGRRSSASGFRRRGSGA